MWYSLNTLFTKEALMVFSKGAVVSSPEHGFVWLEGEIAEGIVPVFRTYLRKVKRTAVPGVPVVVYITGPGGFIGATDPLFRLIEEFPRPAITVAHGHVCSASFLLTQAGASRYAVARTMFHFHLTRVVLKPHVEIQLTTQLCQEILEGIVQGDAQSLAIFGKRGMPLNRLQGLLAREALISLPTARELCLIDGVWPNDVFLRHQRIARKLIQRDKRSL